MVVRTIRGEREVVKSVSAKSEIPFSTSPAADLSNSGGRVWARLSGDDSELLRITN